MAQGAQVIDRAATILSLVVHAEDPISYSDVVGATDLARSTVSRLLGALEQNSLVARDADGRYRAGALFATYAARFGRIESLVTIAQPVLERIGEVTGETVNLALPSGGKVVQAAQVDSSYVLGATNWVEVDVPPHCSALGKVLLAFKAIPLTDEPLESRTRRTITSHAKLLEALERVRVDGYAVTCGELEEGLEAIAAPVRGAQGDVIGSIGVSGPSTRITNHAELGRLLVREAELLSRIITAQAAARPASLQS
ncbi:IclR family transcriptional regulator [Pseudoclavibacter endophyticus]|uniref:IclR family transcriptional regulator n=1 Tax=Pseudoclavibacter endophyticus TaxID=1778590 RepID=A0A6H9WK21_9MICO|nr:IclR family transcriptional regulator [Pseudoclavibacter endophyticus]KAB1649543.1 IclR family transcriptional regulator [Pseudoclavibacter endophyticus]GGA61763.1 IclR family transcriptional regulator [Pseudoclavibacter endophyticus]